MATGAWVLAKDTVKGFIADEALSHGASIAYYTLFAVAPVLLIIIAIAGLVFGREAAEAAIVAQLSGLTVNTAEQGEITAPGPPNVYVRYPAWSSQNDVVVFERGELHGNIWMVPLS